MDACQRVFIFLGTLMSLSLHRHFSLTLQSGAFMQLLLTLVAIASRLHYLALELASVLDDLLPQVGHLTAVAVVCVSDLWLVHALRSQLDS